MADDFRSMLAVGLRDLQNMFSGNRACTFNGQSVRCTIAEVETVPGGALEGSEVYQRGYVLEALQADFLSKPKQGQRVTHPDGFDMEIQRVEPVNSITYKIDCLRINS